MALLAALTVTSVFLVIPGTIWTMAVAVGLFGLPLAPWLAVNDELAMVSVGQRDSAELYGWLTTVGQIGGAVGSAAAGPLAQHYHGGPAFLLVAAALSVALVVAVTRSRTLGHRPSLTN